MEKYAKYIIVCGTFLLITMIVAITMIALESHNAQAGFSCSFNNIEYTNLSENLKCWLPDVSSEILPPP